MNVSKTQKIASRVVATLLVCCTLLMMSTTAVYAYKFGDGTKWLCRQIGNGVRTVFSWFSGDDDTEEETDENAALDSAISFEQITTIAAGYFSEMNQPDDDGTVPGVDAIHTGNNNYSGDDYYNACGDVGIFVAYSGNSWISSILSIANTSASHSVYRNIYTGGSKYTDSVWKYCGYGYTLSSLGLDKTGYETNLNFGRWIMGGLTYFLYTCSLGVDVLFEVVINVLQALNPFRLFAKGVNAVWSGYGMDDMSGVAGTALSGLTNMLKKWYEAIYSFSWAIIVPFFFIALVISVMLNRNAGKWQNKLKKYCIRIAFIVIGVPMLASLYTVMLDKMSADIGTGTSPATKLIISTYMDFESWASHGRLALIGSHNATKEKITITSVEYKDTLGASTKDKLNVRNIAFKLNSYYLMPNNPGLSLFADYVTSPDGDELANYTGANVGDKSDFDGGSTVGQANNVAAVQDMLLRYMDGKWYTSGEFESDAKAAMIYWVSTDPGDGGARGHVIRNQIQTICDSVSFWCDDHFDTDYEDGDWDVIASHENRFTDMDHFGSSYVRNGEDDDHEAEDLKYMLIEDEGDNGNRFINIYANGGLLCTKQADGTYKYTESTSSTGVITNFKKTANGTQYGVYSTILAGPGSNNSTHPGYGLSTLSMYNYLNTSFSGKSIRMYSPSNCSSPFVRQSHYSVNIIGTGFISFLYWLNCIVMLLSYVIIGYWYALGMMFTNISRMFQVMFAVPFAMLGSLKHIAECIVYAIVMILEVVATIFLYSIIVEILFSIPNVFITPLATALVNESTVTNVIGTIATPILLIVLIIFYCWFTIKALKFRKKAIKGLDEAAQSIVSKFIGVQADVVGTGDPGTNGGGKSIIGGALGGAAAGAGAALAGKALTKDASKSEDNVHGGKSDDKKGGKSNGSPVGTNVPTDGSGAGFDGVSADNGDMSDKALAGGLAGGLAGNAIAKNADSNDERDTKDDKDTDKDKNEKDVKNIEANKDSNDKKDDKDADTKDVQAQDNQNDSDADTKDVQSQDNDTVDNSINNVDVNDDGNGATDAAQNAQIAALKSDIAKNGANDKAQTDSINANNAVDKKQGKDIRNIQAGESNKGAGRSGSEGKAGDSKKSVQASEKGGTTSTTTTTKAQQSTSTSTTVGKDGQKTTKTVKTSASESKVQTKSQPTSGNVASGNVVSGDTSAPSAPTTSSTPSKPQTKSVRQAMKDGAKAGAMQAVANKMADGGTVSRTAGQVLGGYAQTAQNINTMQATGYGPMGPVSGQQNQTAKVQNQTKNVKVQSPTATQQTVQQTQQTVQKAQQPQVKPAKPQNTKQVVQTQQTVQQQQVVQQTVTTEQTTVVQKQQTVQTQQSTKKPSNAQNNSGTRNAKSNGNDNRKGGFFDNL